MSSQVPATAFELDDEIVLFAERTHDLLLLNPTSAVVWRRLQQGADVATIAAEVASRTGHPVAEVTADCESVVASWRRLGLVGTDALRQPGRVREPYRWWGAEPVAAEPARAPPFIAHAYRVVDFTFRLRTSVDPAARAAHEFLAHLRVPDEPVTASTLDLYLEQGRARLFYNGRVIDACHDSEDLIPMIHANLMVAAYRASACMVALHAAAVTKDSECILLAGLAGAGKSTLTTALLAAGFGYLADDTVLLSPTPVRVRGVPLQVGLKEGSWPVAAAYWSEIPDLPTYRRRDGKRIRYWLPNSVTTQTFARREIAASALLFPRFVPNGTFSVRKISHGRALMRLAEAGYDVREALDRTVVQALVQWIAELPCYELEYGTERDVVTNMPRLLS